MSGVVLRCPNCGTTRDEPGECEACHEAQVRYYCTNHAQGRWLEKPVCPQCGAKFGDPPPVASLPRLSPASEATASPIPQTRPGPDPRRRTISIPVWRRRRVPSPDDIKRDEPADASSERGPWTPDGSWEEPPAPEATTRVALPLAGCLRMVLLIVLFFLLASLGLSLFLGSVVFYSF